MYIISINSDVQIDQKILIEMGLHRQDFDFVLVVGVYSVGESGHEVQEEIIHRQNKHRS